MTFLSHLYGLVLTLPTATTLVPFIVTLACFHKPLLHRCISVLNNTVYALKKIFLSCYHTTAALALYLWQACKLSLAVMLTPLQLFPFYNLYTMAYHASSLTAIPFLQRVISPTNIIQFFNNARHLITGTITHLGRLLTTPFKIFYEFIRSTRHPATTQLSEQDLSHTTSPEKNQPSTSPPHPAESCSESNQTSAVNQTHASTHKTPSSPIPTAHTHPSHQPPKSWLVRGLTAGTHTLLWTTNFILATLSKLIRVIRFCLWFLLVKSPYYVGNAAFSLLSNLAYAAVIMPYNLLQIIIKGCRFLGNMFSYTFFQALPNFTRSSINYLRSHLFFQHVLFGITLIQARAINLSIQALYINFGYSSFLISSALTLSCPFLIIGLYKLNLNLISTIREKVFHAQPLNYQNQLYYSFIGYTIFSTIMYFSIVVGNIIVTLAKLCLALPNNLYESRQDPSSQTPNLLNLYEDTVPENIRSSLEESLRINFTIAHGRQPAWEASSFLQNLPDSFALSAQSVAPIPLLDQIKGKDETWPCTDDILRDLDTPPKEALERIDSPLTCPITHELIRQPIVCSDGYTYEKQKLLTWLKNHNNVSPLTREPITSLSPNRLYIETLQQAIESLQSSQKKADSDISTNQEIPVPAVS